MKRNLKSFLFAINGIAHAFRTQINMRFHVIISLIVLGLSLYLRLSLSEWCILLFCIGSVLAAELFNTSLEYNIDLSTPELNKKAGQAKDMAAGAVLIVSIMAALIGLIIFIPNLMRQ